MDATDDETPSVAIGKLGQHVRQRQRAHHANVCQLVTEIGNKFRQQPWQWQNRIFFGTYALFHQPLA